MRPSLASLLHSAPRTNFGTRNNVANFSVSVSAASNARMHFRTFSETCPRSDLVPEEFEEDSEDEDAAIVAIIFLPKSVQNLDTTQHAEFLDHGNFNYSTVILFLERVQGKER